MEIRVNGETHAVEADVGEMLVWVLRDELGLIGTKFGCGIGFCGSCTVHVGGRPVRSCVTPLAAVEGREIRTIEGLASGEGVGEERLHPVQQAFLAEQVPQCSWCMSGQMMTAAALLAVNPRPDSEEIVAAMRNNYCRCGCYVRIRAAVARAAEIVRGEP